MNKTYVIIAFFVILTTIVVAYYFIHETKPQSVPTQEEVIAYAVEEFPSFDDIAYAVVDSYEGYIEFPEDASYPSKLLNYMDEWTVSADRVLEGRTYLLNKKIAGRSCKWIEFNGNQLCVLDE